MRVSGDTNGLGVSRPLGEGKPASAPQVLPAGGQAVVVDAVVVSGNAQLFALAQAHIEAIPDIRQEKVDAIKARMDADDYHPDPDAVAEGLVREHRAAPRP